MITLDYRAIVRNLREHKFYAAVNILGLVLGFLASGIMFIYVIEQFSFEPHAMPGGPIYRINTHVNMGVNEFKTATAPAPLSATLREEIPGIVDTARVVVRGRIVVRMGDLRYFEEHMYAVEPSLLNFFAYDFIEGNRATCLDQPNSVVLTQSLAAKYFGSAAAVDQTLEIDGKSFMVTAVIKDPPRRSHLEPRALLSMSSLGSERNAVWSSLNDHTYVRLASEDLRAGVEANLPAVVDKHAREVYERFNAQVAFSLQPLGDIHLGEKLRYELDPTKSGSHTDVSLALFVAFLLIVLASANYAIISVAVSIRRAREIAIRKVAGADRLNLLVQFLFESLALITAVGAISLALLWPLLALFNDVFSTTLSFAMLLSVKAAIGFLGVCLIVAIIGAGYPAFYLSSFEPATMLRGQTSAARAIPMRSSLFVLQISLVMFMIASTWIVTSQFHYLRDTDMGFDRHNLAKLELGSSQPAQSLEPLKQAYRALSDVVGATSASATPGGTGFISNSFDIQLDGGGTSLRVIKNFAADAHFASVAGIRVTSGRFFDEKLASDEDAVVVNETLVRELGWTDPIGKRMEKILNQQMDRKRYRVIGVVGDFHIQSLHDKIEPVVVSYGAANRFLLLRIQPDAKRPLQEDTLGAVWRAHLPTQPFDLRFVANDFEQQYRDEAQKSRMLTMFTALAVIIAFMGVFGIASYDIAQKSKEIAVRRVLGAEKSALAIMIANEFALRLVLAAVLAVPLSYYFMSIYLEKFAYRTPLSAVPFIVAVLTVAAIALLTVGRHVATAVSRNPVDSLRAS